MAGLLEVTYSSLLLKGGYCNNLPVQLAPSITHYYFKTFFHLYSQNILSCSLWLPFLILSWCFSERHQSLFPVTPGKALEDSGQNCCSLLWAQHIHLTFLNRTHSFLDHLLTISQTYSHLLVSLTPEAPGWTRSSGCSCAEGLCISLN